MRKYFFLSFLFFSFNFKAQANGLVVEILSPKELLVNLLEPSEFEEGKIIIIVSKLEKRAVAFGKIKEIKKDISPVEAIVTIEEIIKNSMVMEKDFIYPLNYEILKERNIPGFSSLTLKDDNDIPAQFKELAYLGVFTAEGHTLDKNEVLISPFQLQYGVRNDFGIKIVNALWFDGYANLGLKYKVMDNKYGKISVQSLGAFKVHRQDWIGQFGGILTTLKNEKYRSHLTVNITVDPQSENSRATSDLNLFEDSDIRSINEYITDSWNRVLFGPVYNVELQTFGGTVSYVWIWDVFHLSLGIAARDVSELSFSEEGYYYVYDMFWRF